MREGWKSVQIEDVAKIVNGGTPKTKVADYWDGEHVWITPAEMGRLQSPYLSNSRRKLSDSGLQHSSATLVPPHSVVLSTRAPIGHLIINSVPMAFNQGCRGIVPSENIHHKYLYYFLSFSVDLLNELGSGTTFKELAAGKLKKVEIPLPPLHEQKRIVAVLDEAFAGVATAVANTEKNLANARELFESFLSSVFSQRSEGWTHSDVRALIAEAILEKPLDGNHGEIHPKKSDFVDHGVPFLMARDLLDSGVDQESCHFISEDQAARLRKGFAIDGDVLLSHKGTIGRCAVLDTERPFVVLTPQLTYYRVKDRSKLSSRFLYYYFQSPEFLSTLKHIAGAGSTRAYIGITRQLDLPIVFPAIEVQRSLAIKFDELVVEVRRLESIYQLKLTALAELRQSLLQKAFSGELTGNEGAADKILKEEEVA